MWDMAGIFTEEIGVLAPRRPRLVASVRTVTVIVVDLIKRKYNIWSTETTPIAMRIWPVQMLL
jgi:hypothetical protein